MSKSSKRPKVSVCIAAYNAEAFIAETIGSVLAQTESNFELIIVDDGSTDSTLAAISEFSDPRIRVFQNETNQGVGFTRRRYLDLAVGEFCAVIDADDIWLPNKLQAQLEYLDSNQDYIACGSFGERFWADGSKELWAYPEQDEEVRYRLLWGSSVIHSSLVFRLDVAKKLNIQYEQRMQQAEDYDLLRQLAAHGKIRNLADVLVRYRMHGSQLTTTGKVLQLKNSFQIAQAYLSDLQIELSDEESAAYEKVYHYDYCLNRPELDQFASFIEKLFKSPLSRRDQLNSKMAAVCGASVPLVGFYSLASYAKLGQGGQLNLLKIFLKVIHSFYKK